MVQNKMILDDTFESRCEYYQRVCLGGTTKTQDDINSRLDTAEENFMNSCWKCFMIGRKTYGRCDTDQCPVKVMHRKVIKILFDLSDIIDEHPEIIIPHVRASEIRLDQLVWFWEDFICKTKE